MNNKKRVLFLNPFNDICKEAESIQESKLINGHLYAEIPLGLSYVYTYSKKFLSDIEMKILDAQPILLKNAHMGMEENWKILMEEIYEINPQIIGIGAYFIKSAPLFHETCKRIKKILPECVIFAGGNYATIMPEQIMTDENIDYIILSEGEVGCAEFIDKYFKNEKLNDIDGFVYRDENNNVIVNKKTNYIQDLSVVPIPERENLPMNAYGKGRNMLDRIYGVGNYNYHNLTISRGCPYSCSFCTSAVFWNHHIKYRDTESVLTEMEDLKNNYGADFIAINDDNFLFDRKKASEVMQGMIDRNLNLNWCANGGSSVRALNDDDFLDLAIKSGYAFFNIAIESGSDETLKRIKKPVRKKEAIELIDKIRKKYPDKWINAFFIIGFPFEKKEDILKTLEFSESLDLDWRSYFLYQPIPGSELYEECVDRGIIEEGDVFGKGENFHKTGVYGEDWDSDWAFEINYYYNLKVNFLNNRNMKKKNYEQALRDFEYVISMVPNHAIAYRQAALTLEKMGELEKSIEYKEKELYFLSKESEFKKWYDIFKIEPLLNEK